MSVSRPGRSTSPAAPTAPGPPSTQGRFELVGVRRRDVRRLHEAGPPRGVALPWRHGGAGDPRYPSPRTLRRTVAFAIDLAIHAGGAAGITRALLTRPGVGGGAYYPLVIAVAVFVVLSILHRVGVQWAFRATAGKALAGLCLIRDDTGGRPTLWSLVKEWLAGAFVLVATVSDGW